MSLVSLANSLSYLGMVIAALVGAFLGALFKRMGEDFAAQSSIEKLTATVENIKAAISDDVWDRQEQWKLRRDAVLDAIRALHGLQDALNGLDSLFSVRAEEYDQAAHGRREIMQHEAALRFRERSTAYEQAMFVVDLVIGGGLSKELSNFFQLACSLAVHMLKSQQTLPVNSETRRALARGGVAVTLSARETLGIEAVGDLPSGTEAI